MPYLQTAVVAAAAATVVAAVAAVVTGAAAAAGAEPAIGDSACTQPSNIDERVIRKKENTK